ncbi:MAG TPA: Ig-like domain-containing protein, partial [Thermoanaerobaculia bacterium]|nr:Ig-like domain-containing protein [Thermoanaerobaculia bacterium]
MSATGATPVAAQPGSPLGTAQLQVSGARLTLYADALTTDAEQTVNVGEAARVRTCYGTGAACGTAAPGSVPGLKVVGDLSGPELPQAIPYETAPGGTFFLPGFQREGDYLLSNVRLVETASGRVLANAEPSLATLHVRQILLASASVTRLTLADLQARGITITQQNFNAFKFAVGFVFSGTTVIIDLPVLYNGNGGAQPLAGPTVKLDGLPPAVASAVRRWQPPNIIPFQLNATGPRVPKPGGADDEVTDPDYPLYGAIILPGSVSFLNQFFEAKLIVANGAPNGSGATLQSVTGAMKLPSGEVLRLASTAPPVAVGQKLPVLNANGQAVMGPGEQGTASWTVEGLLPGTHVLRMEIEADLARPGRPDLATGGVVQAAVEVVDARFQLAFNHPDVVRTGEPYSLYVTVTNLSRAAQNLVTVDLATENISGAHKADAQESFAKTIATLAPGASETLEYRLVADVTGTCVATTFQATGGVSGVIRLRAGVGEAGIPLSPAALILPRFTNLLPKSLVDADVRLLGLAYSLATAPAGATPAGLPHPLKADVERRAIDLGEAGQRLYLQEKLLESLEALALDQLGNRHDLPEYDGLRRALDRGAQASTALGDLFRLEQQGRNLTAADFVDHFAATASYGRPWMAAALVPNGAQPAPTLEVRQSSAAGTTYLASTSEESPRFRSLPYGEIYAIHDVPGGAKMPFALVGRLDAAASYRVDLHAPAAVASGRLVLVVPSDDLSGFRKVDFGFLTMGANEVWEVRAVKAAGDAALTFAIVYAGSGAPVPGAPAPSVTNLALPPFRVIGAVQDPELDRYGLGISYLFNRPPDKASAETPSSYAVRSTFHGQDTASPAVTVDRVATKAGAAAYWQPTSERVVNVRYQSPVSALNGIFESQPVIRHEHLLVTNAIRDVHGTPLDPLVPAVVVDPNRTGGLVEGKVLRGDSTPAAGSRVQLLRWRKVVNPDAADAEFLFLDLVAEVLAGADGAFYFDFVEEPPPPSRRIGHPPMSLVESVQSGFTLRAVVPAGADPVLQPEEKEEVSTTIRLQNRLLHVNIALLGRGTVKGRLVHAEDGSPVTDGTVAAASTLFPEQRTVQPAADGSFTFGGLPVGPITLSGRDVAGNRVYQTIGIQRPGDVVNVTLQLGRTGPPKTGTVSAKVMRLRSGSPRPPPIPSPGATVAVYSNGTFIASKFADNLGNATFTGVPAGKVTLQAADFSISRTPALTDLTLSADATVSATLTLAAAAPRSVVGRVLFHDGPTNTNVPVKGAVAFIAGPGSFAYTDATGTYRIDGVPVQGVGEAAYTVTAFDNLRGLQGQTALPPVLDTGDGTPVLAADILLKSMSGGIDGVVVDPLGRPYGGAAVDLGTDITTVARGDGRFSFDDIAVGNWPVVAHVGDGLVAGKVGYFGQAMAAIVFGGHRPFVTIRMAGSGVVNVRTRTSASQGVLSPITYRPTVYANGSIGALSGNPIQTTTDPDGRLALVLPVGGFSLTAVNPLNGNRSFTRSIDYPGQVINLDIVFDSASTVTGRVVGVDGVTPVPNADVTFRAGGLLPQVQRTDGQGVFRYELVPRGAVSVTAAALVGSVDRVGRADGVITGPGQTLDLTVVMKAQGTVRGRVVDVTGGVPAPLAFAQFYVQESGFPNRRLPAGTGFFTADAQGAYEVSHVFAGGVTVVARDRNQVTRQGSARGEITTDFQVLTLPDVVISTAVGSLGVTVRDPDSGGPVADAQITLSNGDVTVADVNGQASFDALPLGTYSAHAFHAPTGRAGLTSGLRLQNAGDRVDAIVVLDTRGQVAGTLWDDAAKTAAVGGGTVQLTGRTNGRSWGTPISALATTSSDAATLGQFLFDGIPPGAYALAAGVTTSPRRAAASLATTPTAPVVSVDLVLEPALDRFVRLFESLAAGVSEVNPANGIYALTLSQSAGCPPGCVYSFTTGSTFTPYPGHLYRFPNVLTSQSLAVSAQESSGKLRTGKISGTGAFAGSGTSSDPYRLVLRAKGRVVVTVRDAVNQPAQANVTLDSAGGHYEAATDAAGVATFDAVLSGSVYAAARVVATGFGGTASGTLQFDDQTLNLGITLAPAVLAHGVVYHPPAGDVWNGDVATLMPESGAIVQIRDSGGTLQIVTTGSDGAYRFAGLRTGAYAISATDALVVSLANGGGSLSGPNGNDNALPPLVLDASRPAIVSIVPPPGSVGVSRNAPVEITFSEPLLASVLPSGGPTSPYFTLRAASGLSPAGAWTASTNPAGQQVVRFTPAGLYDNTTVYSLTIAGGASGVRDRAGRPITDSGDVGSNFTTSDTVGPLVVGTVPTLDRPVDPVAPIRFDFSEVVTATPQELDGSGPTPAAQLFWQQNGNPAWQPVPVTMFLSRGGYSLVVQPPTGVTYQNDSFKRRVHLSRLKDASGNAMADYDRDFRVYDLNPPHVDVAFPAGAPTGQLVGGSAYTLAPVLSSLDDLPQGDVDRVEYFLASSGDPSAPASTPAFTARTSPFGWTFVAAYVGNGVNPRPFPVWVKATDTSTNASNVVKLAMAVLPNAPPVITSIAPAATAPVAGTFYAGSALAATVAGVADPDGASVTLTAELRKDNVGSPNDPADLVASLPSQALAKPAAGWAALPPPVFASAIPITTAEGTSLFFRVKATDSLGASVTAESLRFAVAHDPNAPSVDSFVARLSGSASPSSQFFIGQKFVLEFRARDSETALRTTSIALSGVFPSPLLAALVGGTTNLYRTVELTVPATVPPGGLAIAATASATDWGGNTGTSPLAFNVSPTPDPYAPAATWLTPWESGAWPSGYTSTVSAQGAAMLLRVKVSDLDRVSNVDVPGTIASVQFKGPADAAGTLATAFVDGVLVAGTGGPGTGIYEALWRVPNGVASGTQLPFQVRVVDAGANATVADVRLRAVPPRKVYEAAQVAALPADTMLGAGGDAAGPVFLLDGTTLSLYPQTAPAVRALASMFVYAGGVAAGATFTPTASVLTAPEVTSYASSVLYNPLELTVTDTFGLGHGARVDVSAKGLLGSTPTQAMVLPGQTGSQQNAGGSHGGSGGPGSPLGWTRTDLYASGSVFDSVKDPALPGGGAGYATGPFGATAAGGTGGGVVRL